MNTRGSIRASNQAKSLRAVNATIKSLVDYPGRLPEGVCDVLCREGHFERTLLRRARRLVKQRPDLVPEVLSGTISLYRAEEIAQKGDRIPCPTCHTKGYIFK